MRDLPKCLKHKCGPRHQPNQHQPPEEQQRRRVIVVGHTLVQVAKKVFKHMEEKGWGSGRLIDATGERVDTSLGFTAHSVTPAVLLGSVRGEVEVLEAGYIARSDRQFAVTLTDEQYRTVLRIAEEWRSAPQPSYNLRRHSCVHFVSAIAQAIGLRVENTERLMNKPRSFLQLVRSENPQLGPAPVATAEAPAGAR